jgi:formiminotetrahydrofolate cyclodeaminase
MEDYTKLGLESFLDRTADRTPTPGGGSVTGAAGALACALARMVAAYSVRKSTESTARTRIEETAVRLRRADQLLRALITQDAVAYAEMTEAATSRRLQPARTPADEKTYQDAVLAAVAVPMEMAALVSNALSTMDEFKAVASRRLLSDLAIAAVLADATARSAAYTVRVNARELNDTQEKTKLLSDMDDIIEHCAGHRESIESFVRDHLEEAAPPSR